MEWHLAIVIVAERCCDPMDDTMSVDSCPRRRLRVQADGMRQRGTPGNKDTHAHTTHSPLQNKKDSLKP